MKQESGSLKDEVYSRQEYATANFWDDRYAEKGGMFDWYAEYPELKLPFAQYDLKTTDKILMVGCGNSKLSIQMWEAGYKDIINIDISPTVIQQMKTQFPQMTWEVMDATKMSYKDGQFDVIIDKGTLDALISGKNYDICEGMLKECMRVTKQNGQVLLITYGSPQGRRKIFEPAYPFQKYDYYQCRADLNDLSTMINLMRSNVGQKGLNHIVKDQAAFTKSMREYTLLKFLRQKRKNKKHYILWRQIEKKEEVEVNAGFEKIPKQQVKPQQVKTEVKEVKKEEIIQQNKQSQNQQQSVTYDPKKQSYVWVYSIRRKFAHDIDQIVSLEQVKSLKQQFKANGQQFTIKGVSQIKPFTFYLRQDYIQEALKGVLYLRKKNEPHPNCRFTQHTDKDLENSCRINLVDVGPQNRKIMTLRKINYSVTIDLDDQNKALEVINQFNKILKQTVTLCDLYPCPKTYALFTVMKNRMGNATVNDLLEKFWFPTIKVDQIKDKKLKMKLSLPPVVKEKEEQIIGTITKLFKRVKLILENRLSGCISYFDLTLVNIICMASLCYTNKKLDLIFQQFWEKDEFYDKYNDQRFIKEEKYNVIPNTITFPREVMSKLIAHILAFC